MPYKPQLNVRVYHYCYKKKVSHQTSLEKKSFKFLIYFYIEFEFEKSNSYITFYYYIIKFIFLFFPRSRCIVVQETTSPITNEARNIDHYSSQVLNLPTFSSYPLFFTSIQFQRLGKLSLSLKLNSLHVHFSMFYYALLLVKLLSFFS